MYSPYRIKLLSDQEIEDIYAIPELNDIEQALYFSLTEKERLVFERYRTVKSQVYFMKSLRYFKAKQQFYKFDLCESDKDTRYILEKYFQKKRVLLSGQIDLKTYQKQKKDILILVEFHDWSPLYHAQIQSHSSELIKIYPKGHEALRPLLTYFENQKIVLPSYRTLQDIFTVAYAKEEERLNDFISKISESKKEQLSFLINKKEGISPLNIMRSDQKDFKYKAIKAEVDKVLKIADLYEFSKNFLPCLNLSKNAIRYYADLAEHYPASRLRRLKQPQQWLQRICFIYHRYQHMMDHLITSFIYHTRNLCNESKKYADKMIAAYSSELVVDLPKLACFLKWFPNRQETLNHDELNREAYTILPKEQFSSLAHFLEGKVFDKKAAQWLFYLKSARQLSLYLRPIMLIVPFVFYKEESDIMKFIDLLKKHYGEGKRPGSFKLPKDLEAMLSKTIIPYLKKNQADDQVDAHLFEFFVYQKMYRRLEKGLSEFNKIFKTIHILNLIDNMALRKAIRAARNRTEAYHQLQSFIRKVYQGVFKGKKITTNRVSAQAVRLVANCIIAYNGIILNSVYEKMIKENVSQVIIDEFIRISPIAWVHIAFTGKYSFKKSNGDIDISAMVLSMAKHLKEYFWKISS